MLKGKEQPSLKEMQQMLQEAVTSHELPPTHPAVSWIASTERGPTPLERINVYGEGWYLRLEENLRDDYPAVARLLGKARWESFIKAYIRAHPSQEYTVAKAGDAVPSYLAEWDASLKSTCLPDLAVLERTIYQVRGTVDTPIWNVAELQTLPDDEVESLRFVLQPSVRLLELAWNCDDLRSDDASLPSPESQTLLVYREEFSATYQALDGERFRFLQRIAQGPLLNELVEEFDGHEWMVWVAKFAADGVLKRKSPLPE